MRVCPLDENSFVRVPETPVDHEILGIGDRGSIFWKLSSLSLYHFTMSLYQQVTD